MSCKTNIINENLKTRVSYNCDVLVAGGGVAGIAAALSAARNGASVILIDKGFMLGGLATAGLVTIYLPLCDGRGKQVSFGIAEELLRLSIKFGTEDNSVNAWLSNGSIEEKIKDRFKVRYNAQLFAILAEQLLLSENVKILYGTAACSVYKESDRIKSVIVENKSGRFAIDVKSVVDSTGDADICNFADADTYTFEKGNGLAAWYYYANSNGYDLNILGFSDIVPGDDGANENIKPLTERRFSGLDGEEISEMVELSHNEILKDVLKRRINDNDIMPVTIATIPQIRMTRRIVGEYELDDKEMHKDFEDSIGLISDWRKRGPIYQIPFRCLYGNKVKNLITAGRCISVTDAMWDISRVIPACAVTGEAAGLAASISDDFTKMNIKELQKMLTQNGVVIKMI